jgi:C4-type Zn-finger protein
MPGTNCPVCGDDLVAFTDLPPALRERLEADERRQRQSAAHRREKHTACPSCTLEIHGCGQPYAVPDEATPESGSQRNTSR